MHVLITLPRFMLGGSETYSVTVAEKLEHLGHQVTIYAERANEPGSELAAARKLRLHIGPTPPVDRIDAILSQDAASACLVAASRPDLRQIFVTHGLTLQERLPDCLRPVPPVVVMNDQKRDYVAAGAPSPKVIRLHQPIDLVRYRPRGATGPRARRVLALGNYLEGPRQELLARVCDELNLELIQRGASSKQILNPETMIGEADIVIGYGRVILEAMAMGRAAYVWDYKGGDGWVTPESYPAIESAGFNGSGTDAVITAERLRRDLAAFNPELALFGPDLVAANHSAITHAERLVALFESLGPLQPTAGLDAMSVLIRTEARAAERAAGLDLELRRVVVEREDLRAQVRERERAEQEIARERRRAEQAEARLGELLHSRSWRLTRPLRRGGRASATR